MYTYSNTQRANKMKYQVYGDYGYTSETLLEEFDDYQEAVNWASGYCDRDFGGYNVIEVARFAASGEYVVEAAFRNTEEEEEYFY